MTWRNKFLSGFTLIVLAAGFMSILKSIEGDFVMAAKLIILAGILDGLDGSLARLLKAASDFGARLDTYVDTVSFGVAPAVMMYAAMCRSWGLLGVLVTGFMVFSGVLRFTRGCDLETDSSRHAFRGLPIPVNAVWLSVFVLMAETEVLGNARFLVQSGSVFVLIWLFSISFLVLQLSNIQYTKPTKNMLCLSLLATIVAMLVFRRPALVFCLSMYALILTYVLVMPLLIHKEALGEDLEEDEAAAEEEAAESPLSYEH